MGKLEKLISTCLEQSDNDEGCDTCPKQYTDCAKFKRILKSIDEPWEWRRMEEAFKDGENEGTNTAGNR